MPHRGLRPSAILGTVFQKMDCQLPLQSGHDFGYVWPRAMLFLEGVEGEQMPGLVRRWAFQAAGLGSRALSDPASHSPPLLTPLFPQSLCAVLQASPHLLPPHVTVQCPLLSGKLPLQATELWTEVTCRSPSIPHVPAPFLIPGLP